MDNRRAWSARRTVVVGILLLVSFMLLLALIYVDKLYAEVVDPLDLR